MQTDTEKQNECVTPNSKEIKILKKYFPQCFDKPEKDENGNIIKEHFDVEKLSDILNKDEIEIKKEGFTLNFLGKSYARYQSNLDSETVIVPDKENDKTDSENVYIVGDNLDALQHLKYSYAEKIKCIYIDPPYNTGKEDFVYNDKFGFTAKELVEKLDISEEEAERIVGMGGKCTHSAWLTFMYPRLVLARELLRDDGVIFISIDDNEQANLKRLCEEIFGEGNFVGEIIREGIRGGSKSQNIRVVHDYILCYAKDYSRTSLGGIEQEDIELNLEDEYGKYAKGRELNKWGAGSRREDTPSMYYPIPGPNGEDVYPIRNDGSEGRWRFGKKKMAKCLSEHNAIFEKREDGTYVVYQKIRDGSKDDKQFTTLFLKEYLNSNGTAELKKLFNRERAVFDYSKPSKLIKDLLLMATEGNDIILDFFSGSGTSADAMIQLNEEDSDLRKFIMVQIDEPVRKDSEAEKAGFKTIDEIGRERIHLAAAKLKEEHPETTVDLGFKTYYLKTMPQNAIDKIKVFDPNALISSDSDIIKSLGVSSLLQTWQIKDGFGFNLKPQLIDLQKYTAYLLDDEKIGKYLYLLTEMNDSQIKELIRQIESMELTIDKVFIYGYSFDFNSLTSIKTNLKTLKNRNPIEPVVRY